MLNFRSLLEVVKKELKVLIRSKSSSLIVILGPLLIIFMVGLAFDTSGYHNIKLAVYSEEYSDLAESYISKLSSNAYRVFKVSSEEECISLVKAGTHHACIVFSPNLRIGNQTKSQINIHIDNSKLNIAWLIKDTIFQRISNRSQEISQSLSQILLDTFDEINDELSIRKKSVISLTTKNDELITDANDIISAGQGIKVDVDESKFKTSEFSSSISSASSIFSQYKNEMEDSVSSVVSSINAIQSEAEDLNINDTLKQSLYNAISSAKTQASNISHQDTYESAQSKLSALSSYVDAIKTELTSLKTEISDMTESKNELLSQAQGMKQKLVDQLGKIMEIQQGINTIEQKIANLEVKDSDVISEPIETKVSPVVVKESHLSFLFPNLLVLIVMFVSLLISSTLVQMERSSKAHFRNLITPSNNLFFTFGSFLVTLLVVLIQIIIVLGITDLVFQTAIFSNFHYIMLISLVSSSLFILLGIIIAGIFNSEETSLMATLAVGLVLLLVSGTILPLETMPSNVKAVTELSPFVLSYDMYRDMILFKSTFSTISSEMGYMVLYVLVLTSLIFIMQNLFDKLSLKLHLRAHVPFKVAGKEISGKKTMKSVFVKETKQMEYLRELIHDCKKILSKKNLGQPDVDKVKKIYVKLLNIYDSLPISERKRVFPEIDKIYKKIS
jgi:ABC-2 type transport system permease protein